METRAKQTTKATVPQTKRMPKGTYLIQNGVWTKLEPLPEITDPAKLSAAGRWMREHPNGIGKILDMKAVMK
ncbi:MAG: hypothetical protein LBS63_03555 [Prevotellaceae bacterium]|jgi:hypothetical protein|nr:hypothetical protein [Prevotellaceae bacterium]